MSTSKRIAKRLIAVVLTVMMLMSMVTIGISSVSAASVELAPTGATGNKLYFIPSNNWKEANAWFAAYFFGNGETWAKMTDSNNDGIYEADIPSGYPNVIFLRKNPSSSTLDWNDKWAQTGDLTIPTSGYAIYATKDWNDFGWLSEINLRGSFNDWGTSDVLTLDANGSWSITKRLDAGTYEFKAAASGWDLSWPSDNQSLTLDKESDVTFTFGASTIGTKVVAVPEPTTTVTATSESEDASSSTGEVESQPTTTTPGTSDPEETNGTALEIDWVESNGLYAYAAAPASADEVGTDAWQRWHSVDGKAYRYFYLPASASDDTVIIYNSYSETKEINGVKIDAGCFGYVPYVNGEVYETTGDYSVKILKSDAEGTLYINSSYVTEGDKMSFVYEDGTKADINNTDMYDFLTGGTKNREVKWAAGAVADADGVDEIANTVKKIKGRGNSTWNLSKKPFNITYDTKISVDGMSGKKWSLLANAQDPSLLRNRLVYDLANEVNMTYACDSRFVDWFVNGRYKGSYQLTQKIEMGKNTVMPDLEEPEVEDVVEDDGTITPYPKADFDFILELDTEENAESSGDRGFTTTKGQWMTFKTPDDPADEQYNFMVEKYQAVEDALYGGDIATLETLVNLDDFARAYLINEVAKNLDAGVTSCYFTYNSETGMFTTAPVWDYDNALGNSKSISDRHDADGNMLDVSGPTGWYARDLMHYAISNTLNVFGQACATTTTNAKGETFNDVVLRIWNDEFMPALAVLEGTAEAAEGRLDTVAGYMTNLKDSGQWNYSYAGWDLRANDDWVCDHSSLVMYDYDAEANTYTTSTKSYDQYTLDGQANYAGDWLVSRMNWMATQYNNAKVEVPDGYITIYFENNWQWPDAKVYYWGSTIGTNPEWNGIPLTNVVGQNDQGYDIYEIVIPADITGLLFNGTGEYGAEQCADITEGWYEGICYYMTYDSETNTKPAGSYDYKVPEETTTAPAESTPAATTEGTVATDGTEGTTTATSTAGTTASDTEGTTEAPATTKTVYFQNNWNWTEVCMYAFGADGAIGTAWPGAEMTKYGNDGTYDIYVATVPEGATGIIFSGIKDDGSGDRDQSPNIEGAEIVDGRCYYMKWADGNAYGYEPIEVILPPDEEETTNNEATEGTVASGDEEGTTESGPDMPTVVTVNVVNSRNWSVINAYCWDGNGTDNAWPGVAMEKSDETIHDCDVYTLSFDSSFVNVIFNNGSSQTANLTVFDGQYYDLASDKWYATLEEVPVPELDTYKVYAINSANYSSVNAYAWDASGNKNANWPGVAMTKTGDTVNGADVYEITFDAVFETIIFNNGEGTQTANLELKAGQYYDIKSNTWYASLEDVPALDTLSTDRYIVGEFNGWSTTANEFKLKAEGESYGYVTLTLEANTTYEFKVIREGAWTSCTTPVTGTVAGLQFSSSNADNCTITTTDAGEYVFAFGLDDSKLNVTYPGSEVITPTTPDEEETDTTVKLAGDFTEWGTNAIEMTADENGTVYTTELYLEANTYEFKMIEFGKWLGNNGSIENTCEGWTFRNGTDENGNEYGNCTLVATGGTYTFTFDTTTDKLTITAVLDEIPATVYDVNWPVDNGLYTVNAPATADEGSVIEFTVDAVEGYTVAGVIVNMEEVYADENGVYTWTVTENVNIMAVVIDGSITPDEPTEYNVYAPESEYYTVNAPATVEANGTLTFTIDVADDYVIDYVIVNMVEVYANDANEYVFEDVTEDVEILVYVSEDTSNDTPVVYQEFPVMFVDYDNSIIATQMVKNGELAVAPADPERTGYTFTGWSEDLSVPVTKALLVVAEYKKNAVEVEPATHGKLQIEISGGSGFTLNGRPQGTSYYNTKMPINTNITVTATSSSGAKFIGWVNGSTGLVISTTETYTFSASGNDFIKAMYETDVEGANLVIFKNEKANSGMGQILDMQYYVAGDEITFPDAPLMSSYDFVDWSMTEEAIQAELAAGNNVTVVANMVAKEIYFTVTVNGGYVSNYTKMNDQGQHLGYKGVEVTADTPESGMKFAYWVDQNGKVKSYSTVYVFNPKADIELTAVFVDEDATIEYQVIADISATPNPAGSAIGFSYSWSVPEGSGCTFTRAGIILVNENNFNEDTFYHGTTDSNVTDYAPGTSSQKPTNSRTTNKSGINEGETWIGACWVMYVDADGNDQIMYSDYVTVTNI